MPLQNFPELLRQAEENLLKEKNPRRAVRLYEEFLRREPDSKYAAQSLYAMGWIYEHELADNKQALAAYKKLLEAYPESPMARRVRPKVTAVEQPAKPAPVPPAEVAPETSAATDSAAVAEDEMPLRLQRDDEEVKPPQEEEEKDEENEEEGDEAKKKDDKEKPPEPPRLGFPDAFGFAFNKVLPAGYFPLG
jgi:tetratricopeptide (TPR) repeat protein